MQNGFLFVPGKYERERKGRLRPVLKTIRKCCCNLYSRVGIIALPAVQAAGVCPSISPKSSLLKRYLPHASVRMNRIFRRLLSKFCVIIYGPDFAPSHPPTREEMADLSSFYQFLPPYRQRQGQKLRGKSYHYSFFQEHLRQKPGCIKRSLYYRGKNYDPLYAPRPGHCTSPVVKYAPHITISGFFVCSSLS